LRLYDFSALDEIALYLKLPDIEPDTKMVRLVGFEPTTSAFAGPRSIQTELQAQKISGAEGEI
jgi:hypothetical protein